MRTAFAIFSVCVLIGCSGIGILEPEEKGLLTIRLEGVLVSGVSEDKREVLSAALKQLNGEVRSTITKIEIRGDREHFKIKEKDGSINFAIGHCHSGGKICLYRERISLEVIWHESGHAFMDKNRELESAWKKSGKNTYKEYDFSVSFPHNGILSRYGGTNHKEDFAEWVKWVNAYLVGPHSPLERINKNDYRYLQKFNLLKQYGALRENDYQKIKKEIFQ